MFAKVFAQIFDSSIAENWQTRHVFTDMLTLADERGIVDITHESIARRTNTPLDIVVAAIKDLEQPDSKSRSSAHDGRRIIRLDDHRDWGWQIVNFQKYRESATREMLRMSEADRKRAWRRKTGKGFPSPLPKSTEEEGEAEAEAGASGVVPDASRTRPGHSRTSDATETISAPPTPHDVPTAQTGEKTGQPMHFDEADGLTNKPTLGMAIRYFEANGDYDDDEVKIVYRSFEATKGADGSWWWGKRLVGDWRAAMEARLAENRIRNENRPGAKPVSKILQRIKNMKCPV